MGLGSEVNMHSHMAPSSHVHFEGGGDVGHVQRGAQVMGKEDPREQQVPRDKG